MPRSLLLAGLVILGGIAFFVFSSGGDSTTPNAAVDAIRNGALVVDARTASEYASGHLAGAIHADVLDGDFRQRVESLDRDTPVYVYCASGHRSGRAASILEDMGFAQVVNAGGFRDLAAAGAEVASP